MRPLNLSTIVLTGMLCLSTSAGPSLAAPSIAAKTYHEEGVRLLKAKRFKEAVVNLKRAVKFSPDFAAAWADLANAYLASRNLEKAAPAFTKAIELNPGLTLAYYNLAYVLRKQGKHEGAVTAYKQYLAAKPGDADAYYGMAKSLNAQGAKSKAASAYRRYAELESRPSRKSWADKARARADALMAEVPGTPALAKASKPAPKAAAPKAAAPKAAAPKAAAPKAAAPKTAAPKAKAKPAGPDPIAALLQRQKPPPPKQTRPIEFERAIQAIQDKQYDAALAQLKIALGKAPNDPLVLAALGSAHLGREDPLAAIESYKLALQNAPSTARASIELGLAEAYRLNEDDEEAEELYRKLINDPKASSSLRKIATAHISFVE